jgi:hypothetical protein
MPITFYGKVIDENTNPVNEAHVEFAWTDTSVNGRSKATSQTDPNGLFSLSGVTGRVLSVEASKTGYYTSRSEKDFDYGGGFRGVEGNPVIFQLKRKGSGADLITSRYGVSPELVVTAPRDGKPILVDLMQRKVAPVGQLEIRQIKPDYLQAKQAKAWEFRMEIRDGGFIEQSDEFPFRAPETGYQPVVDFKFSVAETNWTTMLRKQYYISFGEPRRYGWLVVETRIGSEGARLEYAINPDGSRYLEPKEAKLSRRDLPSGMTEVLPGNSQ